jgi:choline dehydrogenase
MRDESDVVIVGAGSAGCVLAARLSADPGVRVLLLEAGPDYVGSDLPPALLDSRRGPSIAPATDWSLQGLSGLGGQILSLPRGRVVGGSSAVNATFALRGSPADYDAWAAAGVEGWAFTDLLPAFRRLETDLDFGRCGVSRGQRADSDRSICRTRTVGARGGGYHCIGRSWASHYRRSQRTGCGWCRHCR